MPLLPFIIHQDTRLFQLPLVREQVAIQIRVIPLLLEALLGAVATACLVAGIILGVAQLTVDIVFIRWIVNQLQQVLVEALRLPLLPLHLLRLLPLPLLPLHLLHLLPLPLLPLPLLALVLVLVQDLDLDRVLGQDLGLGLDLDPAHRPRPQLLVLAPILALTLALVPASYVFEVSKIEILGMTYSREEITK